MTRATLVNTTKSPSADRRAEARRERHKLRETLALVSTIPRIARCGRSAISRESAPVIRLNDEGGDRVAHFSGVQSCGSIHACPVCSPKIRQTRCMDLDAAASTWIERNGVGAVMLLTLTLPHDFGDALARVLGTVRAAFGSLVSGRAWQADKKGFGLVHYVVSHDCTVGKNGWHPHLHVLLFAETPLGSEATVELGDRLYRRWSRAVKRRGHRTPTRRRGLSLEAARNRKDVTRYVTQVITGDEAERQTPVALEMTRSDLKRSKHEGYRSPWQLLADISTRRQREEWTSADDAADDKDVALWQEWEHATKGVRAIRWSRGLRAAVGLDATEQTDEEIAAEEIGGVELFQFPSAAVWRHVAYSFGGRARVLRAAETAGRLGVVETIAAILRARDPVAAAQLYPALLA